MNAKEYYRPIITIKAEVMVGSEIETAFQQAIDLSKKLGCNVEFMFNDVTCFAVSDGDCTSGALNYQKAQAEKHQYKFASSTNH